MDSDDPKMMLRSHLHTVLLTEQLISPEYLRYKVLGTALGLLEKVHVAGAVASLCKTGRMAVAALILLALTWESAGDEADEVEKAVRARLVMPQKRTELATAKAIVVESVGNMGGMEQYWRK